MKRSPVVGLILGACGLFSTLPCGGDEEQAGATCSPDEPTSCGPGKLCKAAEGGAPACVPGCLRDVAATCGGGQVCEEVEGRAPLCFAPVPVRGKVIDAIGLGPVAGARVAARDGGGAVTSSVATSAADGTYELSHSARRKPDGTPLSTVYALRGDAPTFATFPGGIRPALPFDLAAAPRW